MSGNKIPTDITLHRKSNILTLCYDDGSSYQLSAEYLRVHSPSAEVRGHGSGQEVLQTGKKLVRITDLEAVGNYAVKPTYDDGHDSGIYSWEYLQELCQQQDELWETYLSKLKKAGASRESLPPGTRAVNIMPLSEKK